MSETLSVELNRDTLHEVTAPREFHATGSFEIALRNYGEAVHVHLHVDDALSRVAELADGDGNHYVRGDDEVRVPVPIAVVDDAVRGRLQVSTGYGAETTDVDVTVEGAARKAPVDVDERLSRPAGADPDPDPDADDPPGAVDRLRRLAAETAAVDVGLGTVLVVALALAAVGLAVGVGLTIGGDAVLLGVGIVIGGVVAALVTLVR